MRSIKCSVWSVKCRVRSVKCEVWSVKRIYGVLNTALATRRKIPHTTDLRHMPHLPHKMTLARCLMPATQSVLCHRFTRPVNAMRQSMQHDLSKDLRLSRPKCCACQETCKVIFWNPCKLRLSRKMTLDALSDTWECHETPAGHAKRDYGPVLKPSKTRCFAAPRTGTATPQKRDETCWRLTAIRKKHGTRHVWSAAPATQNDDGGIQSAALAKKTEGVKNGQKVLHLSHRTTFDTLWNMLGCHEAPLLPCETRWCNVWNLQR